MLYNQIVAEFVYEGMDQSGRKQKGRLRAETKAAAIKAMRDKGLVPVSLKEIKERIPEYAPGIWGASIGRLAVFTRKFAQLVKTDVPISDIFEILAEEEESPLISEASSHVGKRIAVGTPIGEAMAERPRVFGRLYIRMVEAGLNSGTLDKVAENMAKMYETEHALRKNLQSKMTYPVILLAFCFLVAFLLKGLGFISPPLFGALMSFWGLIAALVAVGMTRPGYRIYREIGFRLPAIGAFMRNVNLARFCRIFGFQYAAGVPLLEALDISKTILQDYKLEHAVELLKKHINSGLDLRNAMMATGIFPRRVVEMVGVGEKGGGVDLMLEKLAEYYELDIQTQSTILATVLYYVAYLAVAVTVGMVVVSFYSGYWQKIFQAAGI